MDIFKMAKIYAGSDCCRPSLRNYEAYPITSLLRGRIGSSREASRLSTFILERLGVRLAPVPAEVQVRLIGRLLNIQGQAGGFWRGVFFRGKPVQCGGTFAFIRQNGNCMVAQNAPIAIGKGGKCKFPPRSDLSGSRSKIFRNHLHKAALQRLAVDEHLSGYFDHLGASIATAYSERNHRQSEGKKQFVVHILCVYFYNIIVLIRGVCSCFVRRAGAWMSRIGINIRRPPVLLYLLVWIKRDRRSD